MTAVLRFHVRLIEPAIAPRFDVERIFGSAESGVPVVSVWLPMDEAKREEVREAGRLLAEAICRMLNGQLL